MDTATCSRGPLLNTQHWRLCSMLVHCLQGDYVVLASEPYCLCGVDVCSPSQRIAAIQRFADSQRQKAAHEQGHGRKHANTHALAGHSDHAPHSHGHGSGPGPGQSAEHAHAATSHDGHALVIDYLLTTFRRQLSPYEVRRTPLSDFDVALVQQQSSGRLCSVRQWQGVCRSFVAYKLCPLFVACLLTP